MSEWDDCKKIAESSKMWVDMLGADELSANMDKAVAAFSVMVSASQIAGAAASLMSVKNANVSQMSAALTAAKTALGPAGWTNIAIAAAAGASTAVLVGAICTYKLKANLSQPSGIEAVKQFIGNVI